MFTIQGLSSTVFVVPAIVIAVTIFLRTVIRLATTGAVTMAVLGFFEIPRSMTPRPIGARAGRYERMHLPARIR
jgi:hypothetical protein